MLPTQIIQWNKNELISSGVKSQKCNQDHTKFIEKWNSENIYDRWWRHKYKVAFGSVKHLEMSHLFMSIEYKEDQIFAKKEANPGTLVNKDDTILSLIRKDQVSANKNDIIPLKGKELDDEFDNLDLKQFDDAR